MLSRKIVIPIGAVSAVAVLLTIAIPYNDIPSYLSPVETLTDKTSDVEITTMPAGIPPPTKLADFSIGEEVKPFVGSGVDVRGSSSTLIVPDSGGDAVWHVPNPAHEKYRPLQSVVEGYPELHVYEDTNGAKTIIMGKIPVLIEEHTNIDLLYSKYFVSMWISPNIQIPEDRYANATTSSGHERIEISEDVLYAEIRGMKQVIYPDETEGITIPLSMLFITEDTGYDLQGHITKEQAINLAHKMISIEQQTVYITNMHAYQNAVSIEWDEFGDAQQYKIVVAPASDPTDKTTYTTDNTAFDILNLEPDTRYMVRAGVQGQDHTQDILYITTLQDGMSRYDSSITVESNLMESSDQIGLEWTDSNGTGENRYRIERSVDGHAWELTNLAPKQDTGIRDTIRPDWLGSIVSYRVFEIHDSQKLYSDNTATVAIPSALDAPQNLRAEHIYEEGIGSTVSLAWDHAPLFRNYIVAQHVDGTWSQIYKTLENTVTIPAETGTHAFRVSSHINGITSIPAEIVITVP